MSGWPAGLQQQLCQLVLSLGHGKIYDQQQQPLEEPGLSPGQNFSSCVFPFCFFSLYFRIRLCIFLGTTKKSPKFVAKCTIKACGNLFWPAWVKKTDQNWNQPGTSGVGKVFFFYLPTKAITVIYSPLIDPKVCGLVWYLFAVGGEDTRGCLYAL